MKAITIVIASALITAAGLKAVPALAETPVAETNVRLVHTTDLDLATDRGQRQLEQRLAKASREVCGSASDLDLEGKNDVRNCRNEVLARARADRDTIVAAARNRGVIAISASR